MKIEKGEEEVNLLIGKFGIFFKKPYLLLDYANDFILSLVWLTGSILMFFREHQDVAKWLFVIGSILFSVRPLIRIVHGINFKRYLRNRK